MHGMEEYENHILSAEMIDHIRQSISDSHTQDTSAYNPDGLEVVNSTGTAHIATVDHQGLAISATTTINRLFGNQIMRDRTGIIMNNEMDGKLHRLYCSSTINANMTSKTSPFPPHRRQHSAILHLRPISLSLENVPSRPFRQPSFSTPTDRYF